MRIAFIAAPALLVLALVGCAPAASPAPSDECLEAIRALDALPDDAANETVDPVIEASLNSCKSADEWMDAVRAYPSAMNLTDASAVNKEAFDLLCTMFPETVACRASE